MSEKKPDEKKAPARDENEGEGNKTADRNYRQHVREFEEQNDVDALGEAARRDLDKDQAGYRAAEEAGKRRAAEEDPELYKKGEKGRDD